MAIVAPETFHQDGCRDRCRGLILLSSLDARLPLATCLFRFTKKTVSDAVGLERRQFFDCLALILSGPEHCNLRTAIGCFKVRISCRRKLPSLSGLVGQQRIQLRLLEEDRMIRPLFVPSSWFSKWTIGTQL